MVCWWPCETPGIPEGSSQTKWLWGGVIAVLIGVAVTKGRDWYIDLLFVAAVGLLVGATIRGKRE